MKEKETNRERFIRIAETRTQKIIDMIDLLSNCSNQYNYEYTQKDVDKMFSILFLMFISLSFISKAVISGSSYSG